MDEQEILEYIYSEGCCPPGVCDICPMSRLKDRGSSDVYVSCWAVITSSSSLPPAEAYKSKAKQLLVYLLIEEVIGDGGDSNEAK